MEENATHSLMLQWRGKIPNDSVFRFKELKSLNSAGELYRLSLKSKVIGGGAIIGGIAVYLGFILLMWLLVDFFDMERNPKG